MAGRGRLGKRHGQHFFHHLILAQCGTGSVDKSVCRQIAIVRARGRASVITLAAFDHKN
jgi:hypothetical protein